MEEEEWHLVETATDRADRSLEAIVRILGNFGEAIVITRSSVTRELIPYG